MQLKATVLTKLLHYVVKKIKDRNPGRSFGYVFPLKANGVKIETSILAGSTAAEAAPLETMEKLGPLFPCLKAPLSLSRSLSHTHMCALSLSLSLGKNASV